jgi:hypothetical protein
MRKDEVFQKYIINYNALYNFIGTMNKETYETYQKNIRKFLASKQAQQYSVEAFIAQFESMVATLVK